VRFLRWDELLKGRAVWFGSATFDERVGLSYTTGQVTHHVGKAPALRQLADFAWIM